MIHRLRHAAVSLAGIALAFGVARAAGLRWEALPPLPDPVGVAGAFSGVDRGVLLVAGGANFPGRMPWEGGEKVWHRTVHVLARPDGKWTRAGDLPEPLAYGVALTHPRGLLCLGGSSADRHHATARFLRWRHERLQLDPLPDLPAPRANATGALVDGKAFVFGGTEAPGSVHAENSLFILDPDADPPAWREGPPLPGPGRMLATAGAMDGGFYVFGGAALHPGPDGKPVRDWLREAWCYHPRQGWKRLADLPRAAVAAPTPAPTSGRRLLVLGGDDGSQAGSPPDRHPGFRRDTLAYDPKRDRWETWNDAPCAPVTAGAVSWRRRIVVPSGEVRPGVRSPEVWSAVRR